MSVICIENLLHASSSKSDGASDRQPTGFALPGYASRAGRKGHALGLTRRWTVEEARSRGAAGGRASAAKRQAALGKARLLKKGEELP